MVLFFERFNSERPQRKSYGFIISTGERTLNTISPVVIQGIAPEKNPMGPESIFPLDCRKQ